MIFNAKKRFKNAKMFIFSRRTHVDAMWHSGPRGSATRAHAAPTRRIVYIMFAYFIYNGYSAFRISEGFSNTLNHCTF